MQEMDLNEALDILKKNNAQVINETTSVTAPTFIMGSIGVDAIQKFMEYIKDDIKSQAIDPDEGNAFYAKINDALDNVPDNFEEQLGEAIFKVLGVDPYADGE
jgi:hypothetical protein